MVGMGSLSKIIKKKRATPLAHDELTGQKTRFFFYAKMTFLFCQEPHSILHRQNRGHQFLALHEQ